MSVDEGLKALMRALEIDMYDPMDPKDKSKHAIQGLTLKLLGWTKQGGWGSHWSKTDHNGVTHQLGDRNPFTPGPLIFESLEDTLKKVTFP